jgi:hypothetical protein
MVVLDELIEMCITHTPQECRIEICCNDIGTLARVAQLTAGYASIVPTIGRWLARQETDPQLAGLKNLALNPTRCVSEGVGCATLRHVAPSRELIAHWATPSAFGVSHAAILREIIGDKSLIIEVDETALMSVYDATSRLCSSPDTFVRVHTEGALVSMVPCTLQCGDCPQETVMIGQDRFNNTLYRTRNLIHTAPQSTCLA